MLQIYDQLRIDATAALVATELRALLDRHRAEELRNSERALAAMKALNVVAFVAAPSPRTDDQHLSRRLRSA
jgi:hypothetical protein